MTYNLWLSFFTYCSSLIISFYVINFFFIKFIIVATLLAWIYCALFKLAIVHRWPIWRVDITKIACIHHMITFLFFYIIKLLCNLGLKYYKTSINLFTSVDLSQAGNFEVKQNNIYLSLKFIVVFLYHH